ncbi:hypothetical protein OG395_13520 [Streptomyces sp. NBC_01320]|nr:hypothetical protein OG395_13520 [Streptomyces sp. NBC_01320]
MSTATLTVKVVHGDRSAEASWADLRAPGTPLPTDGEVRLVHSGEVPSVTVGAPDDVSFTAGELTVELRSATTWGQESGSGLAALTCEPAEEQDGHLATTAVSRDPDAEPSEAPGTAEPGGSDAQSGDGITVDPKDTPAEGADPCPVEPAQGQLDPSDAPKPPEGDPIRETDVPRVEASVAPMRSGSPMCES